MPFIIAGAGLLGGYLQGQSAKSAANTQADAQREAARLAAEEARFRPVGVTTRFGTSQFQTGPDGRVSGAGYNLSPEMRAYQDRFLGLAGQGLTQAEQAQQQFAPIQQAGQTLFGMGQQYLNQPADQRLGGIASQYLGAQPDFGMGQIGQRLLGQGQDQQITDIARQQFQPNAGAQALTSLGQQYLAQSPQEAAQKYMASQQELLAPSRERQMAQLQNTLFQQGRGGLSVGATGARPSGAAGLGATTPEMEAYYNAQAQQDAGLAAQAQQAGQQQASFGAGLLGQGQQLGQGQINFGAGLLNQQQAAEAQRLGLGSALTAQQQQLEQGRYGFGAGLLNQQQAMEQNRASFGAGLFGTGGNLITQGYQGQVGALSPYQAYLGGATGLESLGQQPFDLGINIGAKGMSPSAANAMYYGGSAAAGSNAAANAYNPFATALAQGSQNPQLVNGIQNLFGGGRSPGFVDYTTTGNASSLSPYYQNRLYGSFSQ
jgi:hypothetical protein